MKIILLGAPGAGKGTQAEKICVHYNIPQISTGNIIREAMKNETPAGLKAKEFVNSGALVPDEVVIEMVNDRLKQDDCANGYILDGFPRTVFQAEELDKIMEEKGLVINSVLNIDVQAEKLIDRIAGRRVCKACGATYNVNTKPTAKEGVCDACGGEVYQRADDNRETVENRINVYFSQTAPLIEYYEKAGNIATVNGDQAMDSVFADITKVLGE